MGMVTVYSCKEVVEKLTSPHAPVRLAVPRQFHAGGETVDSLRTQLQEIAPDKKFRIEPSFQLDLKPTTQVFLIYQA